MNIDEQNMKLPSKPRNAVYSMGSPAILDANGQLKLVESRARPKIVIILIFLCALTSPFVCYDFWAWTFLDRPMPEILNGLIGFLIATISISSAAILPLEILNSTFPRKLEINQTEITYQTWGRKKAISWNDLETISTKTIVFPTYSGSKKYQTLTVIESNDKRKIRWLPIAGISSDALVGLIKEEFSKHNSGKELPMQHDRDGKV